MEPQKKPDIQKSLELLIGWLDQSEYIGYDPYDIKAHPWILKITKAGSGNHFLAIFREFVFEVFYTFPLFFRHVLKIKPSVNAKAIGLLASSYIDLYQHTQKKHYFEKAQSCLNWLNDNAIHLHGTGWGYPFNWQSEQLIPAGTPNGIVTTVAGEAFWKYYHLKQDRETLELISQIAEFLSTLPKEEYAPDKICFSYTPVFKNHVHNLNLFVAEFLIRTGMAMQNAYWIELGNKAVNYTLADQHADGSFDYNGPPEKPNKHIDNYHTGFVLRMLHSIWKLTGRPDIYLSLERCYKHYTTHFFEDGRIPKLMPNRKYRIDIHSCAESIHCLSELSCTFPDGIKLAENILIWTLENLQDTSGYFYYGILKSRFTGQPFVSKIPYMRWGQAWMLRAITSYFQAKDQMKS